MSIIDILKENYLYEDENSDNNSDDSNQSDDTEIINKQFVIKLINYLDSKFSLEYGSFDNSVYNEIRSFMDQSDNKVVKRYKERIHKIILDEKRKFLKRIQNRLERFNVPKKKEG